MSNHKLYVQQARRRRKARQRPPVEIERGPICKPGIGSKDAPGSARIFSAADCPRGEPCQLWPSVFLDETDSIARIERRSDWLLKHGSA